MNISFFILFLFALQFLCLFASKRAAKKLNTEADYFLAGKQVSFFPLMMTFIALLVGGGLVLGASEEAYQYGWTVMLYPLGACLGLVLLGCGIGKRMMQFPVSTIAQVLEIAYGSVKLKKIASLFSILSLFMIFVAQLIASKKFMLSIGVDNPLIFIGFWSIVIVYTVMGGLKAIIATDIIQASFFIGTFVLCLASIFFFGHAPAYETSYAQQELASPSISKLCGWLMMPLLFMIIEQGLGQRCLAAKSPKILSWSLICAATCIMLVTSIPVYLGTLAKFHMMEVKEGASVLMTVVQQLTHPTVAALVGCAVLAAIISTADSLINAISSNVSQDFIFPSVKSDKKIIICRGITAAIAILGVINSFFAHEIIDLLILSFELSVSCLFVPIFVVFFRKKGNALSAWSAIAFGACSFCLFRILKVEFPILNVLLSFVGFGCGELWHKLYIKAKPASLHPKYDLQKELR